MDSIKFLRSDYNQSELNKSDLHKDPTAQFKAWLGEALSSNIIEPHAMTLSTVAQSGHPSSRIVLLRGVDESGFIFYSNYLSQKGKELEVNPNAALNFFWPQIEKQVRISGNVNKLPEAISEAYFQSRPRLSQLGAWASNQSEAISDRKELEKRLKFYEEKFHEKEIPKPENWGGYSLSPTKIEFWQGRPGRLHDRFLYTKKLKDWEVTRLAP